MGKVRSILVVFFLWMVPSIRADDCMQALRSVRQTNLPTLSKDEIISSLDEAIKLCPKLVEAYYEYGRFYLNNARFKEAEEKFRKADSLKPRLEFVLGVAYSQWGQKDFLSAENTYKDAIGRYSGDWKLLQGLSVLYLSIGKNKESEELLRQALQEESGVGSIYFNLGMALVALGREDEAMTSLETALRKDPTLSQASLALVQLYIKRDQYQLARDILEPALLHSPYDAKLIEMMITLLEANDEVSEAKALLTRSSDYLNDGRKQIFSALLAIKSGDTEKGLAEFKVLESKYPDDGNVLGAYGWVLAKVGKMDAAESVLARALELNNKDAFTINNLGVVYEKKGLRDKAKDMFERASIFLPYTRIVQENLERLQ